MVAPFRTDLIQGLHTSQEDGSGRILNFETWQGILEVRLYQILHRNRPLVATALWILSLVLGSVPQPEVRSSIYSDLQMLGGDYLTGNAKTAIL